MARWKRCNAAAGQAVTSGTAGEFSGHAEAHAEVTLSGTWRYSAAASDVSS